MDSKDLDFITNYNDLNLDIPRGKIEGFDPLNKFGATSNVDTGVSTHIWDGASAPFNQAIWVGPLSFRIHDIVSDDINDTNAAGTGMRTVEITGLIAGGVESTEVIALNGTTPVPTVDAYIRIYRIKGLTAGSTDTNLGNISATAQVDGTLTAAMLAGAGQTRMAIYTVPINKTLYLTQYWASLNRATPAGAALDIRMQTREVAGFFGAPYTTKHELGLAITGSSYWNHNFKPYLEIDFVADIVLLAENATDNNCRVQAGFDGYLIDIE